jgi:hypothetical protein
MGVTVRGRGFTVGNKIIQRDRNVWNIFPVRVQKGSKDLKQNCPSYKGLWCKMGMWSVSQLPKGRNKLPLKN